MTATIPREDAVKAIAGHLADRDAWIITAPPDTIADLAHNLRGITDWTAYIDSGLPIILRTDQASVLAVTNTLIPGAVVITAPKTIPATTLNKALGRQEIPADGSQDVVILHTDEDGPIHWPLLFVDAVTIVDPRAAATLRAAHIPNLN